MAVPLEPITSTAPRPVARPVLRMRWEALTYVHWDLDPDDVAARLPPGLEPDVHDGRAYVGLVPFRMAAIAVGTRGPGLPFGRFPETNVRTYVRGPDGGRGVYFHSLDIPFAAPTVVARTAYRLPYCLSTMRLARRDTRVAYLARRRWPTPAGAASHLVVDVGGAVAGGAVSDLDTFLSARWSLYAATPSGGLLRVHVHHPPWSLREARIVTLSDALVAAAGYDVGGRVPSHVRFAGDVTVAVDRPRRVVGP